MRKIALLLLVIISGLCFSQTVELEKLSAGKLADASVLYDRNNDDVYGYFYIFEKDKISKTEILYEYVLLDRNLNKVYSGEFKQSSPYIDFKQSSPYVDRYGDKKLSFKFQTAYLNGFISIGIGSYYEFSYFTFAYRLLDVKENKLSDSFTLLPDLTKKYNPEPIKAKDAVYFNFYPHSFGYELDTPLKSWKVNKGYLIYTNNKTYFVNEKLEPLWSYSYNANSKGEEEYESAGFLDQPCKNNKNILVMIKNLCGKKYEKKTINRQQNSSYLFFDKNSGKLISEIFPFGTVSEKAEIKNVTTGDYFIDEAKQTVTFICRTVNSKGVSLEEDQIQDRIQGFSKVEYSISEKKELKRDYFSWNQLSQYLDIDEYGYITEKDDPNYHLYLHDVLLKSNGNTIFILEEYKTLTGGAKVNDLFFMELDKDMKLIKFQRIEKEKKTIRDGMKRTGAMIKGGGYFDYAGYEDLGNDNYLFFYYNKQKPEGGGKKKQWVLGIISYINGKFSEQKLPLKSEDGSDMSITPAKKGYIMIYETFKDKDKSPELRLEKINY